MSTSDPTTSLQIARDRAAARVHELSRVFDAIVDSSQDANLDDEHDPEGSTVGFDRAQTAALLAAARAQLDEIDRALERVERGEYGACEQCGAPIPAARLLAQPATRVCVDCAQRQARRSR